MPKSTDMQKKVLRNYEDIPSKEKAKEKRDLMNKRAKSSTFFDRSKIDDLTEKKWLDDELDLL